MMYPALRANWVFANRAAGSFGSNAGRKLCAGRKASGRQAAGRKAPGAGYAGITGGAAAPASGDPGGSGGSRSLEA